MKFQPGDEIVIQSKEHASLGYNGLECTVIEQATRERTRGFFSADVHLRPHTRRPGTAGMASFWWSAGDLVLITPETPEPTDEEILKLFSVKPHEHVCRECGMKMNHD